jgi:hypothetical protein
MLNRAMHASREALKCIDKNFVFVFMAVPPPGVVTAS